MNKNGLNFSPNLFFKRYFIHFAIGLISLIVFSFVFYFFSGETSSSVAELYRFRHTDCKEAVFTTSDPKENGDSFYLLNGKYWLLGNGKRIFCDTYMVKPNVNYSDNAILFDGQVEDGKMLICKNAATEYDLKIGDEIRVYSDASDTGIQYVIGGYLIPQTGLDGRYANGGAVVLSYQEGLTNGVGYANLSSELDSYYGLETSTFLINLKEKAERGLIKCALLSVLFYLVAFAVSEYFLSSPRYFNYVLLNNEGLPRRKLFIKIFSDTLIKYSLPLLISGLLFLPKYLGYGSFFMGPVALFFAFSVLFSLGFSYVLLRRLTKCYKIKEV